MMVTWTVETLDEDVNEEIEALPLLAGTQVRLLEMVEAIGLDRMREPHVNISTASFGNYGRKRPKE